MTSEQLQFLTVAIAYLCAIWSCTVILVQIVGVSTLFCRYSSPPPQPVSPTLDDARIPLVTVIRPVKGLEPGLYDCLASTFRQAYPKHKLSIRICVASANDPAVPTIRRVIADFPGFDSCLMIESQDPRLHGLRGRFEELGPNPKIRNISRAYLEAKGDVVWIIDCNVWVARGVVGRMVDKLCGFGPAGQSRKPFKFVHQLPLVVDIGTSRAVTPGGQRLLSTSDGTRAEALTDLSGDHVTAVDGAGGRLEEMFMATTHAKFYSAINRVGVAPCIVGKSNMFRKSQLDRLTDPAQNSILPRSDSHRGRGLDYFSSNICEDHLIGDLLWRSSLPGFANHGLVYGDIAIQPMAGMSVAAYIARRVRWLRVRKWTVFLATLVEPGVESLLCCFYLAFAMTTIPWGRESANVLPCTWRTTGLAWLAALGLWMVVDRCVYNRLHACSSVQVDDFTPAFARGRRRKSFCPWLLAWIGRELLALPIWTWAVLLGTSVTWRGKQFKVRTDMSVVQVDDSMAGGLPSKETGRGGSSAAPGRSRSKDRVD